MWKTIVFKKSNDKCYGIVNLLRVWGLLHIKLHPEVLIVVPKKWDAHWELKLNREDAQKTCKPMCNHVFTSQNTHYSSKTKVLFFAQKMNKNPTVASSISFDVNGVPSFTRAFFSYTLNKEHQLSPLTAKLGHCQF